MGVSVNRHDDAIHDLAFSPDGKLLASADVVHAENQPISGSVKLWDVPRFTRNLETAYRTMWQQFR